MKYWIIIWTSLCCTYQNSAAQTCIQDFIFTTQAEIDAFPIDYPDCTVIDGSVMVRGSIGISNDISDLSPLNQINLITQNFEVIRCDELVNMAPLNSDLKVDGSIIIFRNPLLEQISLNVNTSIESNLEIEENFALESITVGERTDSLNNLVIRENNIMLTVEGFEGLEYIQSELIVSENDNLKKIPLFNNASYVKEIFIRNNPRITKFDGFNSLDSLQNLNLSGSDLTEINGFNSVSIASGSIIIDGFAINKIDVFPNLQRVKFIALGGITQEEPISLFNNIKTLQALVMSNMNCGPFNSFINLEEITNNRISIVNSNFENLDFLSNMKRMSGFKPSIRIDRCPNLTDISALDGIESDSVHWFNINRNESLSICHSDLVCAVLERGDNDPPSVWYENGPDCNSTEEILEQCALKEDDPIDPEDPTLCPITSRPGMQINRVDDDVYNIMYHYGVKRMYLRDIAYAELLDLIEYHKVEKDLLFDFNTFTLERYCERAEDISRGESYDAQLPTDPMVHYRVDRTMSEIDFFSNFVLTIGSGESVKI